MILIKVDLEDGYSLIELLVVISIISSMLTTILVANSFIARGWRQHKDISLIQQDLRVSMDKVIESLRDSLYVVSLGQHSLEEVDESKVYKSIAFVDKKGRTRKIYYQSNLGLALNDDSNLISNRLKDVRFQLVDGELLFVHLKGIENKEEFELRSGLRIAK
ncbi:PilW family protein [Halonatronum saccharophilum]|uniref:PilW family protein n=1 Tax=Halonatronum saccharophilum TaxID=150060 RepID=UPI00048431F7|nr:prepilin-type N-terminal cleavage/methylation domain-containing protein [Halonatronum saccharophilum]